MKAAMPAPMDVKLMNVMASALFLALAGMLLAALLGWAMRHPLFAISGITVQGEVTHYNAVTLRANVTPQLAGSLFTMDLARTRSAFEALPWVRLAVVRREFPNRLRVQLQEQHPAAYWGAEESSQLLNSYGEVFEANVGEVEQEKLPRLLGPTAQAAQTLQMYRTLSPVFEVLDATLEQLQLSPQGDWRATLDSGAVIELGSGTATEVSARTKRFVHTVTQVTSHYARHADSLESADLRYAQGYALRLAGVATVAASAAKQ
ncbi:MAG: cell division protein FtsQ/DivIB [Betaproteobacteria bacterium]